MSDLPDDLWRRILEIGIETKSIDYKNLCCLSITCRRLSQLAADDSLWSPLLLSDFPASSRDLDVSNCGNNVNSRDKNCISSSTGSGKFKSLYKIRYEKDREQKYIRYRICVLRIKERILEMKFRCSKEKDKMNETIARLLNLREIRQASVEVKASQPEIIRDRQRQMFGQSVVLIDFRISDLETELSHCKQQISWFKKALKQDTKRLNALWLAHHPLQDSVSTSFQQNEPWNRSEKLKHTSTMQG